jgi:hypothetical protein
MSGSMTGNNIWGLLSKKKKANTLSIPNTPTKTATTTTAPANTASSTPKTVKPAKVKVKKVKPQQVQQQQTQPVQSTQLLQKAINLADFKLATSGDTVGIHIHVLYQDQPIHQFLLPCTDYVAWHRFQPQQKYDYMRMRVAPASFGNDVNLIHQVILTICNILDTLFDNAVRAQQAQAQRRM